MGDQIEKKLIMNRFPGLIALALLVGTASAGTASAAEWPYNEKADAAADVRQALKSAQANHRKVLLVFGANWCKDCRDLDAAMHGSSARLIEGKFEVVKIDVGNFNKNLSLVEHYGDPIKKGIPAVVELSADDQVIYATKGGELADARKMGEQGIYDFLSAKLGAASASVSGGQHLIPMSRARFWGW
ncbi:MAG TPA: thioredoxin family protein [Steroidobacteraceae bacterium]|jgi:protein disulfide-isomerase